MLKELIEVLDKQKGNIAAAIQKEQETIENLNFYLQELEEDLQSSSNEIDSIPNP